jgi:PAS domain S-box-containing protein
MAGAPPSIPVERHNFAVGEWQHPDVDPPDASPPWLDSLFELSPDLMCLAALDGYFRLVNPAFERTLGYTVEECVSRPMLDFVHPEDVERTRAALGVLAEGNEVRQFENRCICRDGSVRWLQWNCRPEANRNGLIAAAARDITDSVRRVEQAALRKVATVVAQGAAPGDVFITVDCPGTLRPRERVNAQLIDQTPKAEPYPDCFLRSKRGPFCGVKEQQRCVRQRDGLG